MIKSQKQIKKPDNNVKLPQIKGKTADPLPAITRPSSSKKVEDLHQKLFSKLDDLDEKIACTKRKVASSKGKRKTNLSSADPSSGDAPDQCQRGSENESKNMNTDNFQQIQKLMPQLYGKLKEMQKAEPTAVVKTQKPVKIEIKERIENSAESNQFFITGSQSKPITRQKHVQVKQTQTQKLEKTQQFSQYQEPVEIEKPIEMSEAEINEIYAQYQMQEPILEQCTDKELEQLRQSLLQCERDMHQVQSGMVDILRKIGYEYKLSECEQNSLN